MYIDPSAGSLIIQLLAAGALAATVMIGRARDTIRLFFRSLFGRDKPK
jgi:hypothetical protein